MQAGRRTSGCTYQLDTHGRQLVSHLDGRFEGLARDVRTEEPARERVACAIGVHNARARDRGYRVHAVRVRGGTVDDDRWVGALGDHRDARARGVGLWVANNGLGDRGDVGGVGFEDGFGVCLRLGFVPDDDVGVGEDLLQFGDTEFGYERCREVENKGLRVSESASRRLNERETTAKAKDHTLLFSDACLLNSSADSAPCVRKNPST